MFHGRSRAGDRGQLDGAEDSRMARGDGEKGYERNPRTAVTQITAETAVPM